MKQIEISNANYKKLELQAEEKNITVETFIARSINKDIYLMNNIKEVNNFIDTCESMEYVNFIDGCLVGKLKDNDFPRVSISFRDNGSSGFTHIFSSMFVLDGEFNTRIDFDFFNGHKECYDLKLPLKIFNLYLKSIEKKLGIVEQLMFDKKWKRLNKEIAENFNGLFSNCH